MPEGARGLLEEEETAITCRGHLGSVGSSQPEGFSAAAPFSKKKLSLSHKAEIEFLAISVQIGHCAGRQDEAMRKVLQQHRARQGTS